MTSLTPRALASYAFLLGIVGLGGCYKSIGPVDAGLLDADGGVRDGSLVDGALDGNVLDASDVDAGDAGLDGGIVDAGALDAAMPDAGAVDGGRDAGTIDGGPREPTEAVAYQIDRGHSGFQTDETLVPPLTQRWHVDFPGDHVQISYPLIAAGHVFVAVTQQQGQYDSPTSSLYAFDQATGAVVWGPIDLGSGANATGVGIAYEAGKVFAVIGGLTGDLEVRAFDALAGTRVWTRSIPGIPNPSAPTAAGGAVYVVAGGMPTSSGLDGGRLYALNASSGSTIWTSDVSVADGTLPALSNTSVFVLNSCADDYSFDYSGKLLWHRSNHDTCGQGFRTTFSDGRLYSNSWYQDVIVDATTGSVLGSADATEVPAIHGSLGFFVNDFNVRPATVTARSLPNLATRWSFTAMGDDIKTAPIVVSGHVFVCTKSGTLYALDEPTGSLVWSDDVGARTDLEWSSVSGLAAAAGVLVVPAINRLAVYW